jgi:nicotinamide-nucleotide amidase
MKLSLIIVGNELLQGKTQELNGFWLSSFLMSKSIELTQMIIVPDEKEMITECLNKTLQMNDVVLISGGLGPTADDITKEALAEYFNRDIIKSELALEIATEQYARIGKDFSEANNDYEKIPEDFHPIRNPAGLAPGLRYKNTQGKLVFALPGVPREFQAMFHDELYPYLVKNYQLGLKQKELFVIRTKKIPEERIFNKLVPQLWGELAQFGYVSSLPQIMNVDICVLLEEEDPMVIKQKKESIKQLVLSTPLKDYIWHFGGETLEEVILMKAKEKGITFGFAESCTGGLNASRMTDIPGASASFWGSITSYSNEVKQKALGVKSKTLKDYGAVSEQTALEMAKGCLKNLNVDIAISTTGIAGPDGGSKDKPVGTIGVGFATKKDYSGAEMFHLHGDRLTLKKRFSQSALFKLLEVIESY